MTSQEVGFEEMVLAVVGKTIEQEGITVEVFQTDTGYGLHDTASRIDIYLDNVTESARRAGGRDGALDEVERIRGGRGRGPRRPAAGVRTRRAQAV